MPVAMHSISVGEESKRGLKKDTEWEREKERGKKKGISFRKQHSDCVGSRENKTNKERRK